MITAFIKKLYEQLSLLLIVALIAMAAYVSLGRQFMPAISGYKSFLEEQIALRAGLPVTIGSIAGEFWVSIPYSYSQICSWRLTTALTRHRLSFLRQELQSISAVQSGRGGGCSVSL